MSLKGIIKSALCVASVFLASEAKANWQFGAGVGYGIGLIEFNGSKENSTFVGNVGMIPGRPNPAMRTTYKYVGNLPQRIFHLEGSAIYKFSDITMMDRTFFAGAYFGFGYGKVSPANGLLNPKAKYQNTGSSGIFWALNGKFGFENASSKIYALTGLTSVKAHLPFDILPLGYYTNSPDIITCSTAQNGDLISSLFALEAQGLITIGAGLGGSVQGLQNTVLNMCNNIKVGKNQHRLLFINLGAGTEVNVTSNLTLFAEYTHMMQIQRNKERSVSYTVNGKEGTFKGKVRATNTDYIKAGMRYYFN